ncbi:MAG: histidine kinase [Nitrosopumilus sp.]|nr:histidine kinase [Nitrosopumilus sp.]
MFMAYYVAYFIIPGLFAKKKYLWFILLLIIGIYLISILQRILVVYVAEQVILSAPYTRESIFEILTDLKHLLVYSISFFYVTVVFLFVKYFINYIKIQQTGLMLGKAKAESDLKALRSQLNPHFLFNTLNNIYTLSLENSNKTPELIAKLAGILDHILYRCNTKLVSISSEIDLLKSYITLEKLRYDDRLKIKFTRNIENDTQIPPLILLSLTENAFKHGAGEDSGYPEIDIEVVQKNHVFIFKISNTTFKDYDTNHLDAIGLANIKKQLDLLYPNKYIFKTEKIINIFTAYLEINQKQMNES